MPTLRHQLRKLLWGFGFDFHRIDGIASPIGRRRKLLDLYAIDTVLDVGANTGQYAEEMRKDVGFKGNMFSFEPLSHAFSVLNQKAANDANWHAFNFALGDSNSRAQINVSLNSYSSSILPMLDSHRNAAPESTYTGKEDIEIRKLDDFFFQNVNGKHIWLKIDTQGFEDRVLRGASKCLSKISTIQLELSTVPLYEGQMLIDELISWLKELGYSIVSLEPGFTSPEGELLQVDGIFHRS